MNVGTIALNMVVFVGRIVDRFFNSLKRPVFAKILCKFGKNEANQLNFGEIFHFRISCLVLERVSFAFIVDGLMYIINNSQKGSFSTVMLSVRWLYTESIKGGLLQQLFVKHDCDKIWILCSSVKNNILRVSPANEGDIVLATII